MGFTYNVTSVETAATTSTTRAVTIPAGYAADDAVFLWAGGRGSSNDMGFAPPSGWTALGSVLRTDGSSVLSGGAASRPYGAAQLWWKRATSGDPGSTATVTRSNGATGGGASAQFRVGVFAYRGDSGEIPVILAGQYDSTGSTCSTTYTPPSLACPTSLCVSLTMPHPDIGGSVPVSADAGFTERHQFNGSSDLPAAVVLDKPVTAGVITQPTYGVLSGDRPWTSRTFALARQRRERIGLGWMVA